MEPTLGVNNPWPGISVLVVGSLRSKGWDYHKTFQEGDGTRTEPGVVGRERGAGVIKLVSWCKWDSWKMILTAVCGMKEENWWGGCYRIWYLQWRVEDKILDRERLTHERGSTEGWRVSNSISYWQGPVHFFLVVNCLDVTRKCNKSIIRCQLKPLTLLPLPSLKFLSYDTTGSWKIIFVKMACRIEPGAPQE